MIDIELERTATTYQIDLNVTSNRAEIALHTVNDNGRLIEIGGFSRGATNTTFYSHTAIFSTVCVGGSLLEYLNYVGTMRSGFYGNNSLFEERNACTLKRKQVERSDFINFVDNDIPRSLTFSRYSLRSHTIEFQARYPDQVGILLVAEDETKRYVFSISSIGDRVLSLFLWDSQGSNADGFQVCGSVIADDEWHRYSISLDTEPLPGQEMSITVTVDGVQCVLQNQRVTEGLPHVIDSPLQFGLTHFLDGNRIFTGCISDIMLRKTADSEIFRPNLEVMPRVSSQFDTSSCYYCQAKSRACHQGQVCLDRGFGVSSVCHSPEESVEQECQGEHS